ncbi:hypothetical protein DFJ77DRAFT_513527 [Powellomyces hirtus]|nr:hypothetical protein DFJ77DRAFT_513527 [Powellomyces hirtus]
MTASTATTTALVGSVVDKHSAAKSSHAPSTTTTPSTAIKGERQLSQRTRSDGSLKEGLLATAHAVYDVAHNAKEALKDACLPLRISASHAGEHQDVSSSSLTTAAYNTSAPRQEAPSAPDASRYPENPLPDESKGTQSWPRTSPGVTPAASSTFPRSARPSLVPTDIPHIALSFVRRSVKSSGGTVTTRDIKKFLKAFPEVASRNGEILEATYSCALDRDGLWHGKMFLTNAHLCFSGTHFTKSAKIIVSYPEITGVEKKSTAGMFPNALRMTVDPDRKYVFSAFLKRDAAYGDIVNFWRNVVSPLNAAERAMATTFADEIVDATKDESDQSLPGSPERGGILDEHLRSVVGYEAGGKDDGTDSESEVSTWIEADGNGNKPAGSRVSNAKTLEMQQEVRAKLLEPVPLENGSSLSAGFQNDRGLGGLRGSNSEPDIAHLAQPLALAANSSFHTGTVCRSHRAQTTLASGIGFIKKMLPTKGGDPSNVGNSSCASLDVHPPTAQPNVDRSTSPAPTTNDGASAPHSPALRTNKILRRLSASRRQSARPQLGDHSSHAIVKVAEDNSEDPRTSVSKTSRPAAPATCDCPAHFDSTAIDILLDLDVETVFAKIFTSSPDLVREAHNRRDTHDVVFEPWNTDDTNGHLVNRDVTYTVSYKPPMLAKQTATGYEKQTVIRQDDVAGVYVVECNVRTPKAPYGEFFMPINRYCLTHAGPGKTRMLVTVKVDFTKRLMWKTQIENATVDGIKAFCNELVSLLKSKGTEAGIRENSSPVKAAATCKASVSATEASPSAQSTAASTPRPAAVPGSRSKPFAFVSRLADLVVGPLLRSSSATSVDGSTSENNKAERHRREKRITIAALLALAVLLLLGFLLTVLNVYWILSVGQRLDNTISGLEKVRELVISGHSLSNAAGLAGGDSSALRIPVAVVAKETRLEDEKRQFRAHNMERAHEKLERMQASLTAAQRRTNNLAHSIADANTRIQDAFKDLDGLLGDLKSEQNKDEPRHHHNQPEPPAQPSSAPAPLHKGEHGEPPAPDVPPQTPLAVQPAEGVGGPSLEKQVPDVEIVATEP